ncbi:MAG: hypothetical protein PHE49_07885 [bacterium]|nr:hypothetical protein [bacterium]
MYKTEEKQITKQDETTENKEDIEEKAEDYSPSKLDRKSLR